MDNPLDPNADTIGGSVDASAPGVADQWRSFLGSTSGRSALVQAGMAMLQPRGAGQTALGQVASAVGSGGEAAARVDENARVLREDTSKQSLREADAEGKLLRADAATLNADTRARLGTNGASPTSVLNNSVRTQQNFSKWLTKEDLLGSDPIVSALGVKSKADIAKDPTLYRRAFELFTKGYGGVEPGSASEPPAPGGPPPGPGAEEPLAVKQAREAITRGADKKAVDSWLRRQPGYDPNAWKL